jgi:hypothetical protein
MNELLISVLQKIPNDAVPIITKTAKNVVVHNDYFFGDVAYSEELGYRVEWYIGDKHIVLYMFETTNFYDVLSFDYRLSKFNVSFDLEEFVKLFN